MARKKKTGSKLLILAGVGVGAYAAYKGGLFGAVSNWIKGAGGGGGTPNDGTDPTETPNPNGGDALGLAASLASIVGWFIAQQQTDAADGQTINNDPNDSTVAPPPGLESLQDEIITYGAGGAAAAVAPWAAAAVITAAGLALVKDQGDRWGAAYSALTPDQQTAVSDAMGVEQGTAIIPNSVQMQKDVLQAVSTMENEDALNELTPAQRKLLDSYMKVAGVR